MIDPSRPPPENCDQLGEEADAFVKYHWYDDVNLAVLNHVFPAPVGLTGIADAQRRARWCRENTVRIYGVLVSPCRRAIQRAFETGQPVRLGDVTTTTYENHLYDRFRTDVLFPRDCDRQGIPWHGVSKLPDGTVNHYAPDALGRAVLILTESPGSIKARAKWTCPLTVSQ